MYPDALNMLVAHVGKKGEPCYEGTSPEQHAVMLADYPREELNDDRWWALDEVASEPPVPTPSPVPARRKPKKKPRAK